MNSNKAELRLATANDYESYYAIRAEKSNLYWTGYSNAPDHDNFKTWFLNRVKDRSKSLYLLFIKTQCVGSLNIDLYTDHAFIGYSVMTQHNGKGLGTELVESSISIIKKNTKLKTIKAWINFQNIGSIRVIEKNGFKNSDFSETRKRFGKEEKYLLYTLNL